MKSRTCWITDSHSIRLRSFYKANWKVNKILSVKWIMCLRCLGTTVVSGKKTAFGKHNWIDCCYLSWLIYSAINKYEKFNWYHLGKLHITPEACPWPDDFSTMIACVSSLLLPQIPLRYQRELSHHNTEREETWNLSCRKCLTFSVEHWP